jgi:DNA topoisomerase-1
MAAATATATPTAEDNGPLADPREAAESAGLVYVTDEQRGLTREQSGDGFRYLKPNGDAVTDEATLARIRKLAIPPAWTAVWICPKANGHLQATGRDARGRKQYRYHPHFREARESTKYEHMLAFAQALPTLRQRIAEHMALRGLPREKVLATIVHLLETTLIRVGNDDYARTNKSYGLTTLRNPHVQVEGSALRFQFQGKSGKTWRLQLRDRRVAKIVRACQELPGQDLFQYVDEAGELRSVSSADVNAYLREVTGRDITAKDFRTWAGTVLAALALQEVREFDSQAAAKRNVRAAIESVASRLGNTPTICRKCYIHPEVLGAYADGELLLEIRQQAVTELRESLAELKPEEAAVLALLQARLKRAAKAADLEGALALSVRAARGKTRQRRRGAAARPPGSGASGQRSANTRAPAGSVSRPRA